MINDELEKLSLTDLERVDRACDDFVAAWTRGERPRLEDAIAEPPEPLRRVIAIELIQAEIECRHKAGERPTVGEYTARFPQWASEVESRFAELPQTTDSNLEATQPFLQDSAATGSRVATTAAAVASPADRRFVSRRELPISPELLSDHEVLGIVGKGGMGVVVRARDRKLDRDVAIKLLVPELAGNEAARQRFLREARAAAAVRHDNVVTIHSVREVDNIPLLEMELIQGESLAERIRRTGAMPPLEVVRIAIQIARGLEAAHKRGLIHRDIKPGNILLESAEEASASNSELNHARSCRVKITDFGLARVTSEASLTNSGVIAGTPQYMSPEQAEGKPIDSRSDLFSLGSVMYAMCAGRAPFHADSAIAILRQVSDFAPVSLQERNTKIPDWLSTIIDRLMAKNPDDRFQSAGEVADVLSQHFEPVRANHLSGIRPLMAPIAEMSNLPDDSVRTARILQLAAMVFLPIAILAAVFIVRTSRGEFVLTTDDPAISARINTAGGLVVENQTTKASYTLMPGPNLLPNGDYELVVTAPDGLELTTSRFQLRRFGGPVTATVTSRPPAAAMSDTPSATGKGSADAAPDSVSMESTETAKEYHDLAITSAWTSVISGTSPADTGKKQGNADWRIENGALVGVVSGQMGKLELHPEVPNQFHLRCEMRVLGSGNSGFDVIQQSASHEFERGYHIDFGPELSGTIAQLVEWKILQQAHDVDVKTSEWTRFEIVKTASTLTAIVDGSRGAAVPIESGEFTQVDLELDARDGESRVEVRKLEVRDIAEDVPAPSENLALRFDGARSYVSIPTLSRNGTVPYTLEAWILPQYRDLAEATLVVSGDSVIQIGKGGSGFFPIESQLPFAHDDPVMTRQEWLHVASVVEAQEVRFYVAGKLTHRLPRSAGIDTVKYQFGGTWFGAHPDTDNPVDAEVYYHFLGHLDEIRMSSAARYQEEFEPATRFECDADTLALYHCDEGSGKELRDSSGYNHHGVVIDVTWESHDAADPNRVPSIR